MWKDFYNVRGSKNIRVLKQKQVAGNAQKEQNFSRTLNLYNLFR